ncbi:CcdB family protein [Endothiovibrio diazotrophicus]
MAQVDVYRNTDPASLRDGTLSAGSSERPARSPRHPCRRTADPSRAGGASNPISRLTPVLEVEGRLLLLSIPELAGIPNRRLDPPAGSLDGHRDEILAALDLLFTGI